MIPAAALIPFTIFVAEELGLILTSLGLVALAIVAIELLSAYAPLPAIPLEPEFRSVMESFYLGFSFLVAGLQAWLLHSLENKRAQKLLHLAASQQHQARLMALGELAANIAHEVRNPLAIIHGKAVQLRRKVTESIVPSEDVAKVCSQVIEASERITRTTSSMLRLGRMEPSNNKEVIDIGRIAQSVGDLCSEHARANGCLFSLSLPEQATMVVGCESELLQVVLNLVNNALYAVRGRPDSSVEIRVECHGGLASLVVEDNGPGIPKGLRAKIMEPFFSTKPEGEGTGLGLSISRAIAVDHGGHLVLDESKVGARFRLDLPMASGHVDLLKKDA
jgi:signal transduction histidine kinase